MQQRGKYQYHKANTTRLPYVRPTRCIRINEEEADSTRTRICGEHSINSVRDNVGCVGLITLS